LMADKLPDITGAGGIGHKSVPVILVAPSTGIALNAQGDLR